MSDYGFVVAILLSRDPLLRTSDQPRILYAAGGRVAPKSHEAQEITATMPFHVTYHHGMGSDIFLWVERQSPSGEWSLVRRRDEHKPNWARDENLRAQLEAIGCPQATWDIGKNYNLFAILADHRNHRADGSRFTNQIIAPPRGLPDDVSDELLADATRMFGGPASREDRLDALLGDAVAPSWATLEELLAVDWDTATHGEGVSGESGDFLTMLRQEIVPIGPPDLVRLVFYFDS